MSKDHRDNFSVTTVRKVAERAAFFCSNPGCHRITIGPDQGAPHLSLKIGEAAHICAASSGGSRYVMSQTPSERKSINNAIWLCASCATLIDKNGGDGYRETELRKWKRDHEALMKECLEGEKRVILQFLDHSSDEDLARRVVHLIEDRGAFFESFQNENGEYVLDSLKELRTSLTALRGEIFPESPLAVIVPSIIQACRHYMNTTSVNPSVKELEYSLGAVRKVVGINVSELQRHYKIQISRELSSIVPN
ncbi:hypothetical protein [Vreelandella sulfidaeris]